MINVRCPTCDRVMQAQTMAEWPHFPFCCQRCRLVDLGRWLDERYRIPEPEAPGEAPSERDEISDIP